MGLRSNDKAGGSNIGVYGHSSVVCGLYVQVVPDHKKNSGHNLLSLLLNFCFIGSISNLDELMFKSSFTPLPGVR
jgi:hypothetical protein